MSEVSYDAVDKDVDEAIRELIKNRYPQIPFSYSIVPNGDFEDGGLGATFNGWRALLDVIERYLHACRDEYECFSVGTQLVYHTLDKNLTSTRIQIRKNLLICVDHADDSG